MGSWKKQWEFWREQGQLQHVCCVQEHHRQQAQTQYDAAWMWHRAGAWRARSGQQNGGVAMVTRTYMGHTPLGEWADFPEGRAIALHVTCEWYIARRNPCRIGLLAHWSTATGAAGSP
eukprot:4459241-Amphidinium_carterae.1